MIYKNLNPLQNVLPNNVLNKLNNLGKPLCIFLIIILLVRFLKFPINFNASNNKCSESSVVVLIT